MAPPRSTATMISLFGETTQHRSGASAVNVTNSHPLSTSHTFSVVADEAETGLVAIVKRWRKPIGEANGTARSRPVKKGSEVTGAKSFVQNPGWGWIRVVNKL